MFDPLTQRIGFACKYMHPDQSFSSSKLESIQRPYNGRTVTMSWLSKQSNIEAHAKLWEVMIHNINSYRKLIEYVSELPHYRHMLRLGSDLLPGYTHEKWSSFYQIPAVIDYLGHELSLIGEQAKESDIRLSMHPGQFCSIVSETSSTVSKSLSELEYHADVAEYMGYCVDFQDFKINVHLSGKLGLDGFDSVYQRMSSRLRKTLTLENDEYTRSIDDLLLLSDRVPVVLDIHHHWIKNDEYIQPDDPRIQRIMDSWRGVRPVIHYSYSNESCFPDNFAHDRLYTVKELDNMGIKKNKLRAHSSMYPNTKANQWALRHVSWADIMCEAKAKNLASEQLYREWKS